METEFLKVLDENGKYVGEETRDKIHQMGFWHETFHCWVCSIENGQRYIYFQLRSHKKKDYPHLYDITAAGHLLADESIADGIREVKEEIGLVVGPSDLMSLGKVKNSIVTSSIIDNEISHVFLYHSPHSFERFQLQENEVSGIVRTLFCDFAKLCNGELESIEVSGFAIQESGIKIELKENITFAQFVPHEHSYFATIIKRIEELNKLI
ncbi:NUDIX domain-containing protein [Alkalihalobacillus sp. LMS39]|uniref:NUDIX hydrolase n=1 Tax=Alkalihalobacillus sp. LMS39 TaxID=2924032 RepID=UPI001FB3113F|nr:NUDIX domain-containing protein [Alkalihalobacillus sp. LMS39]UOE92476.1 NUDIX domain-containing protein [Alkalihalobacillus sp. LMS39]